MSAVAGPRGGGPAGSGAPAGRTAATAPLALLLVACVAQFMLILDDTIVNVALPTIGGELGLSERGLSWIVNAYFLVFGGFLLIGGRVADRVGPRRTFLVSLAAFAGASALCGAAWSGEALVAARGAQGLAAAMLSPAALALLLAAHPEGEQRRRALAAWASLVGLGAATGLLLGGAIVELVSWRWIFLINLPVAAITLAVVPRVVPADDRSGAREAPNLAAALLGTLALLLLVFTVVETEHAGWGSARTLAGFAGVVAFAGLFAATERRATSPLLPASLLRRREAMTANALVLVAAAGLMAMFFFLTLYMQRVLGFSALETGAAFLPFSAGLGAASAISGRMLPLLPSRALAASGMLLAAGGLSAMSRLEPDSSYAGHLLPALVVCGLGIGTALVVAMSAATGGAEERDGGLASALLTTAQQVGGAIGIATMVAVATGRSGDALADGVPPAQALTDGFTAAFSAQAVVMAVAAVAAALLLRSAAEPADEPA